MHRTNIYLTDEQERALDARARLEGRTRSAVIRDVLDRELSSKPDAPVVEALGRVADGFDSLVGGLFDDDVDLAIER